MEKDPGKKYELRHLSGKDGSTKDIHPRNRNRWLIPLGLAALMTINTLIYVESKKYRSWDLFIYNTQIKLGLLPANIYNDIYIELDTGENIPSQKYLDNK